ncbi:hypothetical protein HN873_067424 [Arachis hypogaea]
MVDRLGSSYAVANHYIYWVNNEGRFRKKAVSVVRYSTLDSTWNEIEIGIGVRVEHPTLIGHHDCVDFVTYERSSARFGIHLMTINFGPSGGMEWGWHLFVGDPNQIDTPCVMFDLNLHGVGLASTPFSFDVFDSSLDAVISEAQFRSVGLTNGVVRFVGRIRWARVVSIKGSMEFSACV